MPADVIAIPTEIAQAILAAMPDENVSLELDSFSWRKHLPETGRIVICPNDEQGEPFTRGTNQFRLAIDVAVQIPLPTGEADNQAEIGTALELRQALQDLWAAEGPLRDAVICGATWVGFSRRPIWEPKDVNSQQQFTCVLTPIYQFER